MPCSKIVGLVVTPERPSSAIRRASSPSSSSALVRLSSQIDWPSASISSSRLELTAGAVLAVAAVCGVPPGAGAPPCPAAVVSTGISAVPLRAGGSLIRRQLVERQQRDEPV